MDTKNTNSNEVYIPRCPTCGSPDIRKLNHYENSLEDSQNRSHRAQWVCKTFVCNNCGYAW